MRKVFFTFSCDDGSVYDIKLAELLTKYNVKATFYVPIKNVERANDSLTPEQIRSISQSFEIGGHTYSHKVLTKISDDTAKKEIEKGKKSLEDILGLEINTFCFPQGKYNDAHIQMVKEAGFLFSKTVGNIKTKQLLDKKKSLMFTTLQVFPHNLLAYLISTIKRRDEEGLMNVVKNLNSVNKWDLYSISLLNQVTQNGGGFHLWGHSWEIEEFNLWGMFEDFLKRLEDIENIIYCTNLDLWKNYEYL